MLTQKQNKKRAFEQSFECHVLPSPGEKRCVTTLLTAAKETNVTRTSIRTA